jgi:hypothetical protein
LAFPIGTQQPGRNAVRVGIQHRIFLAKGLDKIALFEINHAVGRSISVEHALSKSSVLSSDIKANATARAKRSRGNCWIQAASEGADGFGCNATIMTDDKQQTRIRDSGRNERQLK